MNINNGNIELWSFGINVQSMSLLTTSQWIATQVLYKMSPHKDPKCCIAIVYIGSRDARQRQTRSSAQSDARKSFWQNDIGDGRFGGGAQERRGFDHRPGVVC